MLQGLTSRFGSGSKAYVYFVHSEMCLFFDIFNRKTIQRRLNKVSVLREVWLEKVWPMIRWPFLQVCKPYSPTWSYQIFDSLNFKGYPWDKLRQGAIVNDVGGGWGHISTQLYKRYPHLNFILQDLPERTEHAKKVWPNECPQAIAENKIQFKSVDLFIAPPVPDCDVYYVSYVYIAFIAFPLN